MLNFYKPQRLIVFFFFAFLCLTTQQTYSQTALQFNGTNQFVTFGAATSTLGTPTFTLECWFNWTGGGVTVSTGTGGLTAAYPLITKGRGEGDGSNVDANYFFGIQGTGVNARLAADFEDIDGATIDGDAAGQNQPIIGTITVTANVWHHAVATFDGIYWRLYLDGVLDNTLDVTNVGFTPPRPQFNSIQHAGLATAMTSAGVSGAAGFFAGIIEEARIWNYARSLAEIQAGMNQEITTDTGLLGRWGLNDGSGNAATNSIVGSPNGTLTNGPTWISGISFPPELWALQFDGTNDYVTFGQATTTLGASTFTLECWFKRTGAGSPGTTGGGGITSAIPLITKGRNESDGSVVDMNYWLGIDNTSGTLAADFEDIDPTAIDGDPAGQNQPIYGTTVITSNVWHHAAATFDGTFWRLYLDGVLDKTVDVTNGALPPPRPQFNSSQYAALGSALNSSGVPDGTLGFFAGIIDEARIWNRALSLSEIQANINAELTTGTGLIGRWSLDDGIGTTATNSIAGSPNGTLTNGASWGFGAPFNITFTPPTEPSAPSDLVATAPSAYIVNLSWTDNSDNEANFEIERSTNGVSGTYTLLATVGANTESYNDIDVSPTNDYCYRVRAINPVGPSGYSNSNCVTTPAEGSFALDLGTSNAYVTFGNDAALGLANITLETWFKREGTGTTTNTGTGGIYAIPLVTKGRGEAENSNVDMNYFLGIRTSDNVLAADFEEGSSGTTPGLNHPVFGTTTIVNDVWYHAAATYDGTTWYLYLNGNLEAQLYVGQPLRSDCIQHAGLGTAINSTGVTEGHFDGVLDEVRIWNYARSLSDIQTTINSQITSSQSGLIARWGLNEGIGTTVNGIAGTTINGTINGTGYSWLTPGAPFDISFTPPAAPTNLAVTTISSSVLQLTWIDNSDNESGFQIERSTTGSAGTYSLLTTVPANTSTYSDENLLPETEYCYQVRAINSGGNSAYTNTYCATTDFEPAIATLTFQEGVNGYAGTKDTHLQQTEPSASHGTMDYFKWDTESGGGIMYGLLRFDDILGSGVGQIPQDAVIQSATLTYNVFDVGNSANLYEVIVDWTEDVTYNDFGGDAGVQPDEYGDLVTTAPGSPTGVYQVDVKSSLIGWLADPTANRGWLFEPSGTDGAQVRSSEYLTTPLERPKLTVVYLADPPNQPVLVAPEDGGINISTSPTLSVTVSDPESRDLTVKFYGRQVATTEPGPDFTIVALPDAQNYTAGLSGGTMAMFTDQTNWCVNQRIIRNIVYVAMEGDITNDNNTAQWANAITAMSILENPTTTGLTDGMPYGIAIGNHDGAPSSTTLYNANFGTARFTDRSYYGGHYGSDNNNNYSLFTAGGMNFIVINLGFANAIPTPEVFAWANNLMQTHNTRRAIIVSHDLLSGNSFTAPGQAIYDALKGNPNLFLMLAGHLDTEGLRTDTYNDNTIYTVRSDYQGTGNGGNGWLRIFSFSPANNSITVSSYSPYLDQSNYGGNGPITLPYDMSDTQSFTLLGTKSGVTSGTTTSIQWPGLSNSTDYEWYVEVDNGENTITGPTWSFTTEAQNIVVNAKVFLEGPYNGTNMNTTLSANLPTTQPYSGAPWNYAGSESVATEFFTTHSNIVDWILIELRSDLTTVESKRAAFLKSDGTIVDLDGTSPVSFTGLSAGDYYVVVRHRNHLAIMSANALPLNSNSSLYDFTTAQSQAYGTNPMKSLNGFFGLISGDASGDGQVNVDDRNATWNNKNLVGFRIDDVTLDAQVNVDDRNTTWNNKNLSSQIP